MTGQHETLDIFKHLPAGYDPIRFVGVGVESADGSILRRLLVAKDGIECVDQNGKLVKVTDEITVRHTR